MMTSDDKVGGWVKKAQNHDDVILEWSQSHHVLLSETCLKIELGTLRYTVSWPCNFIRASAPMYCNSMAWKATPSIILFYYID